MNLSRAVTAIRRPLNSHNTYMYGSVFFINNERYQLESFDHIL